MLHVPKGQRVIQTWSNFNRNHSSFLGKRRISVGIFQNYKISFPGGFMPPLSRFLISFNTNILIPKGKYAQLQFLHYCLPKINEVLFIQNGHRRGKMGEKLYEFQEEKNLKNKSFTNVLKNRNNFQFQFYFLRK